MNSLLLQPIKIDAEFFKHGHSTTFFFAKQTEQEMPVSDIGMIQLVRQIDRRFKCLQAFGRAFELALRRGCSSSEDTLDTQPQRRQTDSQLSHDRGSYAHSFPHKSHQEMPGADVFMVEIKRLIVGQCKRPHCTL